MPTLEEKKKRLESQALSEKEIDLLLLIRDRARFGELTIETRAGQPFRVKKLTEFEALGER